MNETELKQKQREIERNLASLDAERKRQAARNTRRAFWLGQVAPVLCLLCSVLTMLLLFGR